MSESQGRRQGRSRERSHGYVFARPVASEAFPKSHLARGREARRTMCGRPIATFGNDVAASVEDLLNSRFTCGTCKRSVAREHQYKTAEPEESIEESVKEER